jgi:hypothetical protein
MAGDGRRECGMIASRQIAFGRGGKGLSAKDYIQDGLIAMWDGIENAGWGEHDPYATVWKDLVGDDDLVCSGNYSWTKGFEIPAAIHGITKAVGMKRYILPSFTIHICVRIKRVAPEASIASGDIFSLDEKTGEGIVVYSAGYVNPKRYSWWVFGTNNAAWAVTESGKANSSCLAYDKTDCVAYRNAEVIGNSSGGKYINSGFVSLGQLRDQISRPTDNLEIYHFGLYNRALAAEEIAHNYEIDKARFGL